MVIPLTGCMVGLSVVGWSCVGCFVGCLFIAVLVVLLVVLVVGPLVFWLVCCSLMQLIDLSRDEKFHSSSI